MYAVESRMCAEHEEAPSQAYWKASSGLGAAESDIEAGEFG